MNYRVYGVMNKSGANCLIGKAHSIKKALEIVRAKIDPKTYPVFCISEHTGAYSAPWGYNIGQTSSNSITLSSWAVQNGKPYGCERPVYVNIIDNEEDGKIFWSQHTEYFK